MRILLTLFLILSLGGTSQAISFYPINVLCISTDDDRDGSSYEKAIIIEETNSSDGIAAEYKWLRKHYPGYKFLRQSLRTYQGKYYDVLLIKYKGKKKEVYFDINNFFGKY